MCCLCCSACRGECSACFVQHAVVGALLALFSMTWVRGCSAEQTCPRAHTTPLLSLCRATCPHTSSCVPSTVRQPKTSVFGTTRCFEMFSYVFAFWHSLGVRSWQWGHTRLCAGLCAGLRALWMCPSPPPAPPACSHGCASSLSHVCFSPLARATLHAATGKSTFLEYLGNRFGDEMHTIQVHTLPPSRKPASQSLRPSLSSCPPADVYDGNINTLRHPRNGLGLHQ